MNGILDFLLKYFLEILIILQRIYSKLSVFSLTELYFPLNIIRLPLDEKSWQHFLTDLDTLTQKVISLFSDKGNAKYKVTNIH